MASIRKEIPLESSAENVWAAVRDVGALHQRLVPGFVVDTRLEEGARIVTFGNGMVAREDGGIVPGYALKLNSYDLGVDIELADAIARIRFEHPETRALVITPTRGLQDPELPFTLPLLREFAVGDVSLDNPEYRSALALAPRSRRSRSFADPLMRTLGSTRHCKPTSAGTRTHRARRPTSTFGGKADIEWT